MAYACALAFFFVTAFFADFFFADFGGVFAFASNRDFNLFAAMPVTTSAPSAAAKYCSRL
jgi:hypothetical protein